MKHKTWFRLVLKAIGVLLVGVALPGVLEHSTFAIAAFYPATSGTGVRMGGIPWEWWQVIAASGSFLQAILGLYLFLGGEWIVNKAIPSNRPYCPDCGYELTNASGTACPECGAESPRHAPSNPGAPSEPRA